MLRSKDLNISNFIAECLVLFKLLFSYWPNKVPVSHRLPDLVDSQGSALAQSQSYIHPPFPTVSHHLSQPTETNALLSENDKNIWTSSLDFLKQRHSTHCFQNRPGWSSGSPSFDTDLPWIRSVIQRRDLHNSAWFCHMFHPQKWRADTKQSNKRKRRYHSTRFTKMLWHG